MGIACTFAKEARHAINVGPISIRIQVGGFQYLSSFREMTISALKCAGIEQINFSGPKIDFGVTLNFISVSLTTY